MPIGIRDFARSGKLTEAISHDPDTEPRECGVLDGSHGLLCAHGARSRTLAPRSEHDSCLPADCVTGQKSAAIHLNP